MCSFMVLVALLVYIQEQEDIVVASAKRMARINMNLLTAASQCSGKQVFEVKTHTYGIIH